MSRRSWPSGCRPRTHRTRAGGSNKGRRETTKHTKYTKGRQRAGRRIIYLFAFLSCISCISWFLFFCLPKENAPMSRRAFVFFAIGSLLGLSLPVLPVRAADAPRPNLLFVI